MDEKELNRLKDLFFYGKISKKDKRKLLDVYKKEWNDMPDLTDSDIELILYTSHPDYGKPDKDGVITIV